MAFSSNFFLFAFLPIVLGIYFLCRPGYRNAALLGASLLFYAFDAGWLLWILLVSILLNHAVASTLVNLQGTTRRLVFAAAVVVNVAMLAHYKYTAFLWNAAAGALSLLDVKLPAAPSIALPIGISFFTFQAVSYIADVHTGVVKPARRLLDFAMYHSLFPQLIAGPIVRYSEIERSITERRSTLDGVADGIYRFCIGLGKKLIIADTVGLIVDPIFSLPASGLSLSVAWLGIISYTLQIYFDFSGYSDMAIGLGKIFGFDFPENFAQPYRSRSITEFWRRWHMTLSRWFRDYLYIPLGGNRHGSWRTYRNLFVVFFLCGLWHGAAFTFVVWGLYHGALLVLERLYRTHVGELPAGIVAWALTLVLVAVGWVLFRSPTLPYAFAYISALFGASGGSGVYPVSSFLSGERIVSLLVGIMFSLVPFEGQLYRLRGSSGFIAAKGTFALVTLVYAVALLSVRNFNPFIYFRF